MRSSRWVSGVLTLCAAGLSGCLYEYVPGSGGPGSNENGTAGPVAELLVQLDYQGQPSCVTAGIDTLQIVFSDSSLPSATVPCDSQLTGLSISDLPVEALSVTISGLKSGAVILTGTLGVKLVAGFNQAALNLLPPRGTTGGTTGTLTINVQFNGQASCVAAGVDHVRITTPSGVFNADTVPCGSTPVQITLDGLPVGALSIEIDGLSHQVVIFTLSESVTVTAPSSTITANLQSTGGSATSITAGFVFGAPVTTDPTPPGMDCTQAGVQSISATIDGASTPIVVPCTDAAGNDEASIPTTVGVHNVAWSAFASTNGSGTALYTAMSQGVVVQSGAANPVLVDLAGTENGGFQVTWAFPSGGTCATVGAATVTFDLVDAVGNEVTGFPTTSPCSDASFSIAASPGLVPAVYVLSSMVAKDANGLTVGSASNVRLYAPAGEVAPFTVTLEPLVMP
jgi:hypothetical protein